MGRNKGLRQADGQSLDIGLKPSSPSNFLTRTRLKPKKRWGQVFLQQLSLLEQPLQYLNFGAEDKVLEIGAGYGHITAFLLERGARVFALEIDQRFEPFLKELQLQYPKLTYQLGDASSLPWDLICGGEPYLIFGNLPYYLSAPLLERLLEKEKLWIRAVLLLQREFSNRLLARPGSKDYSSLTVLTTFYAEAQRGPRVSRRNFYPIPAVDSSFLYLKRRETPPFSFGDWPLFWRIVRGSFAHRRKTILNNLLALATPNVARDFLIEALKREGIDPRERAEDLSLLDFRRLAGLFEDVL